MTKPKLEDVFAELYGAVQTFRGLGFTYDEVEVDRGILDTFGQPCWGVTLTAQARQFYMHIVPESLVPAAPVFLEKWNAFVAAANAKPPDEALHRKLSEAVRSSSTWENRERLVYALMAKGFTLWPDARKN